EYAAAGSSSIAAGRDHARTFGTWTIKLRPNGRGIGPRLSADTPKRAGSTSAPASSRRGRGAIGRLRQMHSVASKPNSPRTDSPIRNGTVPWCLDYTKPDLVQPGARVRDSGRHEGAGQR